MHPLACGSRTHASVVALASRGDARVSAPRLAAIEDRRRRRRAAAEVSPRRSASSSSSSRPRSPLASAASSGDATTTTTAEPPASSSSFASAASGEWDGMLVTFDAVPGPGSKENEAVARELPREFVPDAFREWELSVRDWQTQCSMNAKVGTGKDAGGGESLEYRLRRLLPSVGCEADATAFVDEAVVGNAASSSPSPPSSASSSSSSSSSASSHSHLLLLATASDGGYALVPSRLSLSSSEEGGPTTTTTRVEACLPLPERAPGGGRRRLRLVLLPARPSASSSSSSSPASSSAPSLAAVEVHSETFDSPFCVSGATLSGCGGSVPQFSSKARTRAEELDGLSWAPVVAAASGGDDGAAAATSRAFVFDAASASLSPSPALPPARKARGGPLGRILLPLDCWATLRPSAAPEGGVVFEAGVLLSAGGGDPSSSRRRRKVVTAAYSGAGELTGVLLATEEAVEGGEGVMV